MEFSYFSAYKHTCKVLIDHTMPGEYPCKKKVLPTATMRTSLVWHKISAFLYTPCFLAAKVQILTNFLTEYYVKITRLFHLGSMWCKMIKSNFCTLFFTCNIPLKSCPTAGSLHIVLFSYTKIKKSKLFFFFVIHWRNFPTKECGGAAVNDCCLQTLGSSSFLTFTKRCRVYCLA